MFRPKVIKKPKRASAAAGPVPASTSATICIDVRALQGPAGEAVAAAAGEVAQCLCFAESPRCGVYAFDASETCNDLNANDPGRWRHVTRVAPLEAITRNDGEDHVLRRFNMVGWPDRGGHKVPAGLDAVLVAGAELAETREKQAGATDRVVLVTDDRFVFGADAHDDVDAIKVFKAAVARMAGGLEMGLCCLQAVTPGRPDNRAATATAHLEAAARITEDFGGFYESREDLVPAAREACFRALKIPHAEDMRGLLAAFDPRPDGAESARVDLPPALDNWQRRRVHN